MTKKLSTLISLKNAEQSEAKSAKRRFATKYLKIFFVAKLRFALLASLRLAIFSEIKEDEKLVKLPEGVNSNRLTHLGKMTIFLKIEVRFSISFNNFILSK